MTKYSTELKIEIVSKYLNHEDSIKGLAKQYNIHWTLIQRPYNLMCKDEQFLKVNQNWV